MTEAARSARHGAPIQRDGRAQDRCRRACEPAQFRKLAARPRRSCPNTNATQVTPRPRKSTFRDRGIPRRRPSSSSAVLPRRNFSEDLPAGEPAGRDLDFRRHKNPVPEADGHECSPLGDGIGVPCPGAAPGDVLAPSGVPRRASLALGCRGPRAGAVLPPSRSRATRGVRGGSPVGSTSLAARGPDRRATSLHKPEPKTKKAAPGDRFWDRPCRRPGPLRGATAPLAGLPPEAAGDTWLPASPPRLPEGAPRARRWQPGAPPRPARSQPRPRPRPRWSRTDRPAP